MRAVILILSLVLTEDLLKLQAEAEDRRHQLVHSVYYDSDGADDDETGRADFGGGWGKDYLWSCLRGLACFNRCLSISQKEWLWGQGRECCSDNGARILNYMDWLKNPVKVICVPSKSKLTYLFYH